MAACYGGLSPGAPGPEQAQSPGQASNGRSLSWDPKSQPNSYLLQRAQHMSLRDNVYYNVAAAGRKKASNGARSPGSGKCLGSLRRGPGDSDLVR